ncbi:hypothetical protein PV341_34125 [Streptomyces sp. PA03-1a]|nr:hypothetical protein [Streptomyces sp. PA03-1a]
MGDRETARQARLRLTRRRPAPNRVQARERAEQPEAPRSWWRRISWVGIVTNITVVIGIGSLAFTGIATYYGAAVSRDQLKQSQQQDEDQKRAQASRVSFWTERPVNGGDRLHLMNRSPDPVTDIRAFFIATRLRSGGIDAVPFRLWLVTLPPCSDTVIEAKTLRYSGDARSNDSPWEAPYATDEVDAEVKDSQGPWFIEAATFKAGIYFLDRDGAAWTRTPRGLDYGEEPPADVPPDTPTGKVVGEPLVKPVKSCGDDASS